MNDYSGDEQDLNENSLYVQNNQSSQHIQHDLIKSQLTSSMSPTICKSPTDIPTIIFSDLSILTIVIFLFLMLYKSNQNLRKCLPEL